MKKIFLEKTHKEAGFGLVEVIVSLTILVMIVLAFNHLSNMAFMSWENAKNKAVAYNIIQDTFEDIRNQRDTNVNNPGVDWFENLSSLNGLEEQVDEFPLFTKKITIEDIPTTLGGVNLPYSKKKITIEVFWRERLGDRSLKSETYLTDWRGKY